MYIAYYDEAGDDGFPHYSSPLFVLTCVYIHEEYWKEAFDNIKKIRNKLKEAYNIPVKTEFHMKYFLLNKHPYKSFNISNNDRINIIDEFCNILSTQKIKSINVVINKTIIKKQDYEILDNAFTYSIQRIENDLKEIINNKERILSSLMSRSLGEYEQKKLRVSEKFLIITDEGRLSKMRKTARKIRQFNPIPSRYNFNSYNQTINLLVEDPMSKRSDESFFIQISDLISYIVYLYSLNLLKTGKFANRIPEEVTKEKVYDWMEKLKPILNLQAASSNEFGVVIYPKT